MLIDLQKNNLFSFNYCFKSKTGYPAILKMNNLKKNIHFKIKMKKF